MPTIPLLPAPVNLYRDASRSSQRIRQKEKRITRKTLDTLVRLPEFTITHFSIEQRREESILHLYGKHNELRVDTAERDSAKGKSKDAAVSTPLS